MSESHTCVYFQHCSFPSYQKTPNNGEPPTCTSRGRPKSDSQKKVECVATYIALIFYFWLEGGWETRGEQRKFDSIKRQQAKVSLTLDWQNKTALNFFPFSAPFFGANAFISLCHSFFSDVTSSAIFCVKTHPSHWF